VRSPTLEEADRCKQLLEEAERQARSVLARDPKLGGNPEQIENKISDFENCFVEPAGKTQGCFIATACYGSVMASEIIFLSAFRDQVMSKHKIGRLAVRLYYVFSPSLANVIAKRPTLKRICLRLAVGPAVRWAKRPSDGGRTGRLANQGMPPTAQKPGGA